MSKINRTAASKMQEYVAAHGFDGMQAVIRYAISLTDHYGEAVGALACQMYEETAAAQGVTVQTAEMADLPTLEEVRKAVYGAKKTSEKEVSKAIERLVKRVGADTTLKNAERDGAQFAWVPHGDTCAFCITLASRGWQYMSKNALRNGHAEHIHANCDCQYAIRFDDKSTVAGYDPDRYKKIYDNMPGRDSKDKINALRRMTTGENALTLDQIELTIDLDNTPQILGQKTPAGWNTYLKELGFTVGPLGRGQFQGIPFEDGGGYCIHYRGDGYMQYHPEGGHHKEEYYKISSGATGTRRFHLDGSPKDD